MSVILEIIQRRAELDHDKTVSVYLQRSDMSYKRKTSSLSQSSGSDLSDAGKELELLATKKHKKSYAYSR